MRNPNLPAEFLDSLDEINAQAQTHDWLADLPPTSPARGDARSIARLIQLIDAIKAKDNIKGIHKWFDPTGPFPIDSMPKHKAFFKAGATYAERLFMAANRVGKSVAGAYEITCHLTGDYPDWWEGRVFDHPTDCWAVGPDARTVRDTIQKELLGALGEEGTGMIPASAFGKASALQGTPQAIDVIRIRHKSGGWSTLGFKNYKQDIQAFMGTSRHAVWGDEEMPIEVWNECNIRTATCKGIMLATFTPLQGLTRMVVNFCKKADFLCGARPIIALEKSDFDEVDEEEGEELIGSGNRKAVIQAGWDDAPWLDEETKARLLDDTPEYLKEARSKGIPSMGAGAVFPIPLENVICDPFPIPDNWPRMFGLDVGWNRTAVVWVALDPNNDCLYVYDEYYVGQLSPEMHAVTIKLKGDWIRGVIDPATRGRGQADGQKMLRLWKDTGLKLLPAKNEREAGIQAILQRLSTDRLKFFRTCTNLGREYILYRRKMNGQIEDENDHALDALRYVINNTERMSSKSESKASTGIKYNTTRYGI